jgi:sensor histidine kinase YesM
MNQFGYLFRGLTFQRLLATAGICALVAFPLVWVFEPGYPYILLSTLCVGFTITLAFTVAGNLPQTRIPRAAAQMIAVLIAAPVGTLLTAFVRGGSLVGIFTGTARLSGTIIIFTIGLVVGGVIALIYIFREQKAIAETNFLRAESERHHLEKTILEARLQLLQAQIEPHFLFNTLANMQHLIEADAKTAARMLENLIRYLRIAMPQMRDTVSTVGREMDMAAAYLEIFKIRMGTRLSYEIELPHGLRDQAFPPMMLITLVENAIKHGVDPCCDAGSVVLSAEVRDDKLLVRVADTGQGLQPKSGTGVGLTNIRERLATLFGKAGRLQLTENLPRGMVATIEVPLQRAVEGVLAA